MVHVEIHHFDQKKFIIFHSILYYVYSVSQNMVHVEMRHFDQ